MLTTGMTILFLAAPGLAWAGAGDVQTKTDHPWYPGELSCSNFERLFKTEADLYTRVTGKQVETDQDKVLAAWYWRNLHYYHSTDGMGDLWGKGLGQGDAGNRDYWSGLFAHGYGLCFSTHHQWHGEMASLLGPGRSRCCGVEGHASFEVFLKGDEYGDGKWVLLDHDISTVYFTPDGKRLMGLTEVNKNLKACLGRNSSQNRGWQPAGLHPDDPGVYGAFKYVMYASGYAGVPPIVYLRSGESLKRFVAPGLEDGRTYVFWGVNYNSGGIPGPHRDRTWVNQPERMYQARRDCGSTAGARYGNALYVFKPDFAGGKYKEAAVEDTADHVTLEFFTPYVIGCTPADTRAEKDVGQIYQGGASNGLVIHGQMTCPVSVSTDQGKNWQKADQTKDGMDLTDLVKGRQQYWLRFDAPAKDLAAAGIWIKTVCQAGLAIVPRVQPGSNTVTYQAGGLAFISVGPDMPQVQARLVDGKLGGNGPVTLELRTPRGEKAVHLYTVQRQVSGSPPSDVAYNSDYSTDGGATWKPVVKDFKVIRHDPEPPDWWSQSHAWGDVVLDNVTGPVRVRFDPAGRQLQRVEAHLVYRVQNTSPVKVTFAWKEGAHLKKAAHTYPLAKPGVQDATWSFQTGPNAEPFWVEYAAQ
jgi:hypothetical protein